MCACLPYLKFLYDFVNNHIVTRIAESFHSRSRTRTRTKTKSKLSDPNHEHPFQELGEGSGIHRKTDITVSTVDDERPAGVPKGYVRNEVVRNDIRRHENDFERRQRETGQQSRSGESVLLE